MPEELIPIILFISLFTYLSVLALANMITNIHRTKSSYRFMQGMIERGYSVPEIEKMMKACQTAQNQGVDLPETAARITPPVPPVKHSTNY